MWAFIKRWVLPGIWLTIVTFGTYYLFWREDGRIVIGQYARGVAGVIVLTYIYLLWKQRKAG